MIDLDRIVGVFAHDLAMEADLATGGATELLRGSNHPTFPYSNARAGAKHRLSLAVAAAESR